MDPDKIGWYLQAMLFFMLLLFASVQDLKTRLVSDRLHLCIALTSLLAFHPENLWGILIGMMFLIAGVLLGGIGGGDIKLMLAAGPVLGFAGAATAAILGLTAALLFYACSCHISHLRKGKASKHLPLVPFLSAGCTAAYFIINGGLII